jgi:hypothetical protein
MRQQEATEPSGEVPAVVVVHGNTCIEVTQDTGGNLRMVKVEDLEAIPSQGVSGPEAR